MKAEEKNTEYGLNASSMVETGSEVTTVDLAPKKRGPGRPPKNGAPVVYTDIITEDTNSSKKKRETYEQRIEKGYAPQAMLIQGALAQTNDIYNNIDKELEKFRDRPSYGGKTRNMAMAEMMNTQVSLINVRLSAIRELNNIRNKINDLSMKHDQIMKETGENNSDKMISDAYSVLLNAQNFQLPPILPPLHQTTINTNTNLAGQPMQNSVIGGGSPIITDDGSNSMMAPMISQPLNPIQQRMILEKNPSIKTVVVYDQNSGNKYFDVIDVTTGRSVPNVPRPGNFLLDDMRIDQRNGIASNSNANMTYPLVMTGTRVADEL